MQSCIVAIALRLILHMYINASLNVNSYGDEAFVELVEGLACTCEVMIGTLMEQVKQSISSMERIEKNTRN